MKANRSLENRNLSVVANVENTEGKKYISGIIPYNSRSQFMYIGYSDCNYEMLAPTVFNKTIADRSDIYVNYAHNDEHILGRLSAGTLEVTNTPDGLTFKMQVPNTPWGEEAYGTIESGNCRTISFEFIPYTWKEDYDTNTVTLTSAKLTAISLCVINPAYTETDTITSIRCLTNKLKGEKREMNEDTVKDILGLIDELKKFVPVEKAETVEDKSVETETKKEDENLEVLVEVENPNTESTEKVETEQQEIVEQSQPDTQETVAIEEVDTEYEEKVTKLVGLMTELETLMS